MEGGGCTVEIQGRLPVWIDLGVVQSVVFDVDITDVASDIGHQAGIAAVIF